MPLSISKWQEDHAGKERLPGGLISPLAGKIRQYGQSHLTWTSADISMALGVSKGEAANVITNMVKCSYVRRVSRGVYRCSGVV